MHGGHILISIMLVCVCISLLGITLQLGDVIDAINEVQCHAPN